MRYSFLPLLLCILTSCAPPAGCVTRDPREVERKKHGRLGARKKPAWVKR
ncbi:30S ribosomal protein S9 [Candidatus Bathyarchaeota archaeon]|nr:30S ribosomal protein S9 [Candidatus Bathyarchaeota archaeon]